MTKTVLGALALLVGVGAGAAAQVPAGVEFRVNSNVGGFQGLPAVSMQPNGAFVAVWTNQFGTTYGVSGRRFDAAGVPQGADFRIDVPPAVFANFPDVATDDKGRFVVVWRDQGDGSDYGILGRRFSASGAPLGGEFVANNYTTGAQGSPSVAIASGGGFVVTWDGGFDGLYPTAVLARRFDSAGGPLGPEFTVSTYPTGSKWRPSVAAGPGGRFVVAWTNNTQDGSGTGVFGQRFDPAGTPAGAEFRINSITTGNQRRPEVAMAGDGSFVVAWQDYSAGPLAIVARRFDPAGAPIGAEFVVTSSPLAFSYVSLGSDQAGNFMVVWEANDGNLRGVAGRRFSASGAPRGAEFRVNTSTVGQQFLPDLASDASGNLLATWDHTPAQDTDVLAQRYGGLLPAGLSVTDGGNTVLEVADNFTLVTSWRNLNGAAQTFQGRSSAPVVPPGLQLTSSPDANYGTVPNGAVGACSAPCFAGSLSGTRPPGHVDLSFLESLLPDAQGQAKRWSLHVGDTFSDVPRTSNFYRSVETLVHQGITTGCGGSAYCPLAAITRDQMTIFVLVAKEGASYVPPACTTPVFSDVPASNPFCRWIEELYRRGVVGGCGGGQYCPSAAVTREQMAVFVLLTLDPTLNPPACTTPIFSDVPASSSFCRWIEELYRRGVVSGCGGGQYCPTAAVTREQMSVFISATFGLSLYGP